MADREASGDLDDRADTDRLAIDGEDGIVWGEAAWVGSGPDVSDAADDRFDPFDATTWKFTPVAAPRYGSRQAAAAMAAMAVAVVAIVVSIVLLALRVSSGGVAPSTVTTTAPPTTTTATTAVSTSELPPPPPPPPPVISEAPPADAPVSRPRGEPRQTKAPEIGVTRTPVTRSQISASPQRPSGRGPQG